MRYTKPGIQAQFCLLSWTNFQMFEEQLYVLQQYINSITTF